MRKLLIAGSVLAAACIALPACAEQANAERHHGRGAAMLFEADANKDGVITRAEFDAGRTAHFAQMDENHDGALAGNEVRRRHHRGDGERGHRGGGMTRADANNDGNISREEFLARPNAQFERMDANKDGVISANERPQRRERPDGERRGARFNPDANNDGRVTQAEFTAQGASLFQRLDANSDGRVTREEAEAGRPPRREAN